MKRLFSPCLTHIAAFQKWDGSPGVIVKKVLWTFFCGEMKLWEKEQLWHEEVSRQARVPQKWWDKRTFWLLLGPFPSWRRVSVIQVTQNAQSQGLSLPAAQTSRDAGGILRLCGRKSIKNIDQKKYFLLDYFVWHWIEYYPRGTKDGRIIAYSFSKRHNRSANNCSYDQYEILKQFSFFSVRHP